MKKQSYAEMATKAFSKYILDDAALKKLHACLLIITDDVDKACRKYSIKRTRKYPANPPKNGRIRYQFFLHCSQTHSDMINSSLHRLHLA